jgi:endonuclease/exonuclease/phosphatase family metal-dependent hydrolase
MIKVMYSWVLVAVLLACATDAGKKQSKPIEAQQGAYPYELLQDFEGHPVVFYNVENLFDTLNTPGINDEEFTPFGAKGWNSELYQDKLMKLAKAITFVPNHRPLLIGLAEIENTHVVRDLVLTPPLNEERYRIAHYDSPDGRGIDVALAYDLARFYVLHSEPVAVEIAGERPTRDILYVKGLLQDSIVLHVFVNHWPSRWGGEEASRHKRVVAAERLKHKTDSIQVAEPLPHILIMGDLNDHPNDVSVHQVLGALPPAEAVPGRFVNLMYPAHDAGEGTHSYKGNWGVLDHLIVNYPFYKSKGKITVQPQERYIVKDEFLLFTHKDGNVSPNRSFVGNRYVGGYSDHLPVYLYLERTNAGSE